MTQFRMKTFAKSIVAALLLSLLSVAGFSQGSEPAAGSNDVRVIDNGNLRFGTGNEDSVGPTGLLRQPFYYSGQSSRQLTFSNYPLDLAFGFGNTNGNQWNGNDVYSLSEASDYGLTSRGTVTTATQVDYSGFTATTQQSPLKGYGTIKSTTEFTVGGKAVRFEHTYRLGQNDDFVRIETKVTNISGGLLPAASIWVGTRDDYVGGSDVPNKKRGNITANGFAANTQSTAASNAIQISTDQEGVLFYSVTENANTVVNSCCSFGNVTGQNPATSTVDVTSDGSYAMYLPVGDLANGASKSLVWFYAAGSITDLNSVIQQVAEAGAAEQAMRPLTTSGGTLNYRFNYDGTAYYMVVDRGATAPSAAELVAGLAYGTNPIVTPRAAGSAELDGSGTAFTAAINVTGLSQASQYTIYTATQYRESAQGPLLTSNLSSVNFSTLSTAPQVNSVTAGDGQVSVEITGSQNVTNFEYSTDGGTTWNPRSPAGTSSPWIIGSLNNGTEYSFKFRSVFDSQGGEVTSTFTATPRAVPSLPRNINVSYGATSGASVSWLAPTSSGGSPLTGYTVQYQKGGSWISLTPNGNTVQISDVWLDVSWSIRIAANNAAGSGAFATFTNTPPIPSVVTGGGTTTLITPTNQTTITASPGQTIIGTINNGNVTPVVGVTVTRVTANAVNDIQTQAENILTEFNNRWDGNGNASPPAITSVATPDGAMIYGLVADQDNSEPIGVPAENVILVTTNDQAVLLAGVNRNEPAKLNAAGALVVNNGSLLGFAVNGFAPGVDGELVLMSNPTMLGTFRTDANGSFTGQAIIPSGFPIGNHTAVLITSNLVTSMGLVVEAASLRNSGYTGPLITHLSRRVLSANQSSNLLLTGEKLSMVTEVRVGTRVVPFTRPTASTIRINLPGLEVGIYDIVLEYSGGARITHQAALRVTPQIGRNSITTWFAANRSQLSMGTVQSITREFAGRTDVEKVRCTGSTSGTLNTPALRRLALQRARAACLAVKSVLPEVETELRTRVSAGNGPFFRSSTVEVIEPSR